MFLVLPNRLTDRCVFSYPSGCPAPALCGRVKPRVHLSIFYGFWNLSGHAIALFVHGHSAVPHGRSRPAPGRSEHCVWSGPPDGVSFVHKAMHLCSTDFSAKKLSSCVYAALQHQNVFSSLAKPTTIFPPRDPSHCQGKVLLRRAMTFVLATLAGTYDPVQHLTAA